MAPRWLDRPVVCAVCVLIISGCTEAAERAPGVVVRDSAAVQIVESRYSAWDGEYSWVLSEVPEVQIGVVEGDARYQFFRIADALRLSDERLAVIDEGAHELRIYSPEGEHLRTVGGEGDGPGELRYPQVMYRLPGDSILVIDFSRMSLFDPDGDFVRVDPRQPSRPMGVFTDRSVLYLAMAPEDRFEAGQVREAQTLVRAWVDPPRADTLGGVPGAEVYRAAVGTGLSVYLAPFGRTRMVAVHDDVVHTGDGSGFEVRLLDQSGEVTRIVRRLEGPRTVTPEVISRHEEQRLENARSDSQRETLARLFREWSYPDEYPAYDRLIVDQGGHIWLRRYVLDSDGLQEWSVLDYDGVWLGEISMPPKMEVMDIGPDYVLGVARNDLGVEFLVLHRLWK